MQQNAFFARPENVLVAVLGDSNEEIRMLAVNKVLSVCGNFSSISITNENFKGGYIVESDDKKILRDHEKTFTYDDSIYWH